MSLPDEKNSVRKRKVKSTVATKAVTVDKSSSPSPVKRSRATRIEKPEAAPLQTVVLHLVYEAVAARIRHRTLLLALENGQFDKEHYFECYKTIYDRDNEALFAQLMLEHAAFNNLFKEWHEADIERYGIPERVAEVEARRRKPK